MTPDEQELLRRLSISDAGDVLIAASVEAIGLNDKISALNRIAALIAVDAGVSSYQRVIDDAIASGATESEVVGVLITVAPIVGLARVASAASGLALALGYDVEQALE